MLLLCQTVAVRTVQFIQPRLSNLFCHATQNVTLLQANKQRKELHDQHSVHIRKEFSKYWRVAQLARTPIMQMHIQSTRRGPSRRDPVNVFEQLVDRDGRPIWPPTSENVAKLNSGVFP